MQLSTITMDRGEARRRFLEYRRSVRERHSAEDAEIMRGYRELARGAQLIRLSETLKAGGSEIVRFSGHEWRVPKLAACRADAKFAFTTGVDRQGGCVITADKTNLELSHNNRRDRTRIPGGTFEAGSSGWWNTVLRAMVPIVPPPLRPAHALSGYTILWEAEWAPHPAPPIDPALLKRIGGDLYAVVAIWDLTDLERAVLARRQP